MKIPFLNRKIVVVPSQDPILAATATVVTPAIPLPSNNPEWKRLEKATTKAELAALDADLERQHYSRHGQLRTALKQKYEAL
jgi:hypothetical protein